MAKKQSLKDVIQETKQEIADDISNQEPVFIPDDEPEAENAPTTIHYLDYLDLKIKQFYDVRFNTLLNGVEVSIKGANTFKRTTSRVLNSIWIKLCRNEVTERGKELKVTTIERLLENDHYVKDYHPLRDYLFGLKWDGRQRIKTLAETLYIEDVLQRSAWPGLFKRWLLNCASIATGNPYSGTSAVMIVLEGPQRRGKTSWLNNLCPPSMTEYLFCGKIDPDYSNVNTANYLAEKWIINIDDQLKGIFAKDFDNIKAMVTIPNVTNRKSYDKDSRVRQRTASFVATVNGREIFTDNENRRYMAITVGKADAKDPNEKNYFAYDKKALEKIDMNQVWAEVMWELKAGEKVNFTDIEAQQISAINLDYQQVKPEYEWLVKCYQPLPAHDENGYYIQQSEMYANVIEVSGLNRLSQKGFSQALEKAGFKMEKRKAKEYGGQVRNVYYVRHLYTPSNMNPGKYDFQEPYSQKEIGF